MSQVIDVTEGDRLGARARLLDALAAASPTAEVLCIAESVDAVLSGGIRSGVGGPLRWEAIASAAGRVLVSLRAGPSRPTPDDSVLVYMRSDHARIHALVEALAAAAASGDRGAFGVRRALLDRMLRRHIMIEEAHLFPVLLASRDAAAMGAPALGEEHLAVVDILDLLRDLGDRDEILPLAEAQARHLALFLSEHGEREEGLVYGLADLVLDEGQRASLIDFCRALS